MSSSIDTLLSSAVGRGDAAGVAAIAVGRDGTLLEGAAGHLRLAERVPLTTDAIFQLASMTKVITSACAMQLIAAGALSLDSPAADVLPEIGELKILRDDGSLVPPRNPVTLRHLMTHTSGLGYTFMSPVLAELARAARKEGGTSDPEPLLFEPGSRWGYGASTAWVGRMVEAVSGQSLDEYMADHVFDPLGMTETTYGVAAENEARVSAVFRRSDAGLQEQPFRLPPGSVAGDGGLCSTARDYGCFLRMLLNDGELDGTRVLSAESVAALATNQIGDAVAGRWGVGIPQITNAGDASDGGTAGHGLGGIVSGVDSPGRRSAGTLSWAGIFNTYYWVDRSRGVAGAIFTQILPFWDAKVLALLEQFETQVYAEFSG